MVNLLSSNPGIIYRHETMACNFDKSFRFFYDMHGSFRNVNYSTITVLFLCHVFKNNSLILLNILGKILYPLAVLARENV